MTARPEVIITGILDGTLSGGCPKVIELFVTGTVNLNYYEVWRSLNGAPFGSGSGAISSMTGVYTNTFVYLVKTDHVDAFHDVFGNEGIFGNVVPMGIVSGNGNDGFQVRLKVGSVVVDQVWMEDATYSYENSYWYRKHGTGPDGGWIQAMWETPGNDALEGLDQDGLQAAVPFGTYAMAWKGLTSDWNSTSNWSLGIIPSYQTNVFVPDTSYPFPLITNLPENPAICMNLMLDDTASMTVQAGKALTVKGDLILDTMEPGEIENGLFLACNMDQGPSGSLICEGSATGTVLIKRYIDKNNKWHFISAPVTNQTFWPSFVPIPINNSFDLYYWDEAVATDSAWINCRKDDGQWNPAFGNFFIPGKGYLISYAPENTGNLVRTFKGTPTCGDFSFSLDHIMNHWSLLGNPYTCAMDWSSDGIDKSNIAGNAMYIWDPALNNNEGGYRTHNGTTGVPSGTVSTIPALQGFFVQSTGAGLLPVDVSLNDPLIHGGQAFYKNEDELTGNRIRMKIMKGPFSDEMLIVFNENATNGYDVRQDALKLFHGNNHCPEIYSEAGPDKMLCINMLAEIPSSVPIDIFYPAEDSLTILAFDHSEFKPETGIFLEDKLLGQWIDFRTVNEYRFRHDPSMEQRFELHFMNVAGEENPASLSELEIWSSGKRIFIINSSGYQGNLHLNSLDGKLVQNLKVPLGESCFQVDIPSGLYIARLITRKGYVIEKIMIN